MKKILATGFVPFAGADVNPAGEIVKQLTAPPGTELICRILPVEYTKTREALRQLIDEYRPDAVVSFGQGGIRPALTPEKVAINFSTTRSSDGKSLLKDESGEERDDLPLESDAPQAYFSTLPIRKMCSASQAVGVAAGVSYTAGTYLCNAVMFTSLHAAATKYHKMRCGFVHVPFLPQQMPESQSVSEWPISYSMSLEDMVRSAQAMLKVIADEL